MEHLGTIDSFVHAAELGSFVEAGRKLGLSASAVGKAISRLETHLGVRLFHRNTRSMTLTEEGRLFLNRSRRILEELKEAELELSQTRAQPSGKLKVSLPMVGHLLMPALASFLKTYPDVVLDLDFTDRSVDVIEEGYDVVIRVGASSDSRLMRKSLGRFTAVIVASPSYIRKNGRPKTPKELEKHFCLRQRSPTTGKFYDWHLRDFGRGPRTPSSDFSATTIEPLVYLAERGHGIACVPPFAIEQQLKRGTLIKLLDRYIEQRGEISALWPTSRQLSPKVRAFIDHMSEQLDLEKS